MCYYQNKHVRLLYVTMCRGDGGGMAHRFGVEDRLKVACGWRTAGRMDGVRNVLVSELNKSLKEQICH